MHLREVLKELDILNYSELERENNIPTGSISRDLKGHQKMSEKHWLKLESHLADLVKKISPTLNKAS